MNSSSLASRTGGQLLVQGLVANGVSHVFSVPGESFLGALDALYDASNAIRLVVCRQEGGAAYMAEAYGKLTGRPGVAFVTRGPGATNASVGVHTAFQDSTPMILFIGQVARGTRDREAFQEVDYRRMYGPLAKWVAEIDDAARVPEYVSRAFHVALSGRPGPVVLAIPEDVLTEAATVADVGPARIPVAHPDPAAMARLRELLVGASKPLMIVGGGGWSADASRDLQAFAAANNLPVGCAFRRQDSFDNHDDHYIGDIGVAINSKLAQRVRDADLVLAVGPRLGEMTTSGYTLLKPPAPAQKLIHVLPDPDELNSVYKAEIAIVSGMAPFAAALRALAPVAHAAWDQWTEAARADYLDYVKPLPIPGSVQMAEIVAYLNRTLPKDSIVTNGAGNFAVWAHRFYQFSHYGTQLGPTSGSMGYGVPSAVAAKILEPNRTVVSFSGDGCFLMNGQELATAVAYGANAIFIVVNNGMLGTIRMHQEKRYPGRVIGTELRNPDFAALARAYGANGDTITRTEDFAPAFARALKSDRPTVLEIRLDPEAITPIAKLADVRAKALAARGTKD
ncbi:MAG: thiamine pyrophosphate-binding protein [Rhodospirillales bacterium]|nr:thiamine pyrophosphate-binding protein [Rhodospirillales bacterium]MSP80788.1 thiamine pyrophosphate-binding protein [Rhodospirillales bacterium]